MVFEFKGVSMTNQLGEGLLDGDSLHIDDKDISSQLFKEFINPDSAAYYIIQGYFWPLYVARIYSIDILRQSMTFGFDNPDNVKYPPIEVPMDEVKSIHMVTSIERADKIAELNFQPSDSIAPDIKAELRMMCQAVLLKMDSMQIRITELKAEAFEIVNFDMKRGVLCH